jgi:hypothetical protein
MRELKMHPKELLLKDGELQIKDVDGWRVVDDDDYNQSVGNPKRKV